MMARTLSALPPELLLEITECLEAKDLARLVRTSTSFAALATPVLYDHLLAYNILRTDLIAELKSEYVLSYFTSRVDRLLALRGERERTIVYYIVASGNSVLVDVLIKQGVDFSTKCEKRDTPLLVALENGHEDIILRLLDAGVDVLFPPYRIPILGYTHENISRSTIERVIEAIQAAGGDIHAPVRNGHTALHHASRMGRETLAATLLDHGADVLATNHFGHVPLVAAVVRGKVDVSRILLDAMRRDPRPHDLNAPLPSRQYLRRWVAGRNYEAGDTILHGAVRTGRAPLVQMLLAHGGVDPLVLNNPETREEPRTPFDLAIEDRNAEIVQLFAEMENGPAFWPSSGAIQRGFELHIANPYPGTVRVLLELYKQGKVSLDIAAAAPAILAACRLYENSVSAADVNEAIMPVLALGLVDINAQNIVIDGKTALHLLCSDSDLNHQERKLELIDCFLQQGADWTIRDHAGDTVLHCAAAARGIDGVVRRIIESADTPAQKAIIPSRNKSGMTPLHFFVHAADFALAEHRATATLLIEAGCDPNARANNGETVAHWAISPHVSADSLRFFVSLGMNLTMADKWAKPPISAGCDAKATANPGDTGARRAISPRASSDPLPFLMSLGVDLSVADEPGGPPMHSLATRFLSRIKPQVRAEAIRYLVEQGADLHAGCRDCEGWVMRACSGIEYGDMCGR
ncbi:ankyrin repeat-containing domain protein [Aspergillus carlsbadensis]|nr:ankyrin repeat-containing domain protein [Aspergillus carlsbadensis]